MNKILKLFDEQFVIELLKKEVLPQYPHFSDIVGVKIHAYKKHIWEYTYHVVIEFKTIFLTKDGKRKQLPIICSAHSGEPRKNVYDSLRFLWEHDFNKGYLSIPHPLFYSDYFQGTFYRGVEGNTLYHYIREKDFAEIENIIPKSAAWFAKLHNLKTENARNFNEMNSRIETVVPGIDHLLSRVKEMYPKHYKACAEVYEKVNKEEKEFLASTDQRWLVHGDAHPENIIRMSKRKIALIDFTDICLTDFARDIGSFVQQLEFMCERKIGDQKYFEKIKNMFLDNYFNNVKIKLDDALQKRIDNYYYWTAMRTAVFFLIKDVPEPERGYKLMDSVCNALGVKC